MCLLDLMEFDLLKFKTIIIFIMRDVWQRFVSGADLIYPWGDFFHIAHAHSSGGVGVGKALVTPILKKHGLDVNILANYRPVSNLPFTAKVMEKIAVQRLSEHLTSNGIHEELQSAYKPLHSTETAVMLVQHDIANAMDTNQVALLLLLDMSAAFDTIDANILIDKIVLE